MFPWVCLCILTILSSGVQSRVSEAQDNGDELSQSLRTFLPPWIATRPLNGSLTRWMEKSSKGEFYGQSGEDKHAARRYFHNMHSGIFLEMGGLDGKSYSNSKHFEESKNWWGMLIEPNPKEFAKIYTNRPQAIAVNAAVCAQKRNVHFIARPVHSKHLVGEPGGPTLNWSPAVAGIWEFMSLEHKKLWYGITTEEAPAGADLVPCLPLSTILQMFGVTHIDFFSLDVEGAELEVLKSLDFSAVRINVIVVEQDGSSPEKDEAVRTLLLANGFELDRSSTSEDRDAVARNDWFINKQFRRSEAPHEAPSPTKRFKDSAVGHLEVQDRSLD